MKHLQFIKKNILDAAKGFVALLILVMLCAGCEPESRKIEIYMNLQIGDSLDFEDSGGGEKKFSVSTNTIKWSVSSSDPSLFKVSQSAGSLNGDVTVTAERNTTSKKKEATITIRGTGIETRTVRVTIAGAPQTLSVSAHELTFPASGESRPFTVTSNTEWDVSCDANWITVTPKSSSDNGSITVEAEANAAVKEREAEIKVSCTEAPSQTIRVKQEGATPLLTVSTTSLTFSSVAEQKTFTIESNTEWEVTHDALSWLTVTPNKGSGRQPMTVSVIANGLTQRTANITVRCTGIATAQTVKVTQAATTAVLTVSPGTLTFAADRGSQTFRIESNTTWKVSSNHSWLTVSPLEGSITGNVTATAAANTAFTDRTAIITVTGAGVSAKTISVTQRGAVQEFNVSPTSLTFSSNRETQTLTITSNTSWTISSSNNTWLTIVPINTSSSGRAEVTAAANTGLAERSAQITVRSGSANRLINVTQRGIAAVLNVSSSALFYGFQGNTQTVNITSNTNWNAVSNQPWLTVSPAYGSNSDELKITAIANPTGGARSGRITISGEGVQSPVTISVDQSYSATPFLIVTQPPSLIYSADEESKSFVISSNTSWKVQSNVTWLSVTPEEGSNNGTVTVRARTNASALERIANITFSGTGTGVSIPPVTIRVTQQKASR